MEQTQGYIQASIDDYREGVGWYRNTLPDVAEAYMAFTDACFAGGAVTEKNKHLIALGISVHAQDEYCIMYHAQSALSTGASDRELMETVAVSAALGGGLAMSQGLTVVRDVIEEYRTAKHQ